MLRNLNHNPAAGKRILGTPRVGVLGSAIPTDSYLYPSLDLPGDATKFYRGWVVTRPAQGVLTTYENGAYEYDSTGAVGQQSFTVQLYEQGVLLGSPITVSIDVVLPAPTVTSVTVAPSTANVSGGATQQFTATVSGANSPPTTVNWSVSPAGATISSSGLFTAPSAISSVQTFTVTATSTYDGTKSGTSTVTVPASAGFTQYPAVGDVRSGVRYGASGEYTGTLVPGSGAGGLGIHVAGGLGITTDGGLVLPVQ